MNAAGISRRHCIGTRKLSHLILSSLTDCNTLSDSADTLSITPFYKGTRTDGRVILYFVFFYTFVVPMGISLMGKFGSLYYTPNESQLQQSRATHTKLKYTTHKKRKKCLEFQKGELPATAACAVKWSGK